MSAPNASKVALDPKECYVQDSEALSRNGLWVHTALRVFVCRLCQTGLTSQMVAGHLKNQHDQQIASEDRAALGALVAKYKLHERAEDVPAPCPGGPPVEGVERPVAGFSCHADSGCNYSVRDEQCMPRHVKEKHGHDFQGARSRFRPSTVQALFRAVGRVYFEVDTALEPSCNVDLRQRLRQEFLPKAALDDVLTQEGDRDRPPLLKITQRDQFSVDIRNNQEEMKAARRLKSSHAENEAGGMFTALQSAIDEHAGLAKHTLENHAQPFTLAKVLLHGREVSPEQ